MTPLTPEQTHAYLHHIGIDDPGPPSLAKLDRLIDAHLRRVAFENLDVLLDRPIEIDADKVFAKVVEGSRGGYCFELNSLFARLTLADGLFGQRAGNGETLQRQLRDVEELLDILQTRFRLRLDPASEVPALARRLAGLISA